MKMPNGFGSVYKLSGKRRKPWVSAITIGWNDNGKQIRKIIGYSSSRSDAIKLLVNYNNNPYDINKGNLTFKNLYNLWLPWKIKNDNPSNKSIDRYKSTYKYFKPIENKKFIDITYLDLQRIIDECKYGYSTKSNIKMLYSLLYDYAKIIGVPASNNVSQNLRIGTKQKSDLHINFSEAEIKVLWNESKNDPIIKLILIFIYTGARPKELLTIKEIKINENYMIGGCKTDAGIDRIIPIHNKIKNFVIETLANENYDINYKQYLKGFKETMEKLRMKHLPYDTRHTFATRMDNINANKICTKLILGHSISDITDGTYTHKTIEQLLIEVNKLT